MKYSYLVPRRFHYLLIGAIFYWFYANKFLTYSVDYVTQMSRDLSFGGVQQNIAYYSNESLILSVASGKRLSNLFRESFVLELKWSDKIDFIISDDITNSSYKKFSFFEIIKKYLSKRIRKLISK